MKTQILGLKELRENVEKYITQIKMGKSFVVVKRSEPVFKISSAEDESDLWETVVDFTKINKKGISAKRVLSALRKLNASS